MMCWVKCGFSRVCVFMCIYVGMYIQAQEYDHDFKKKWNHFCLLNNSVCISELFTIQSRLYGIAETIMAFRYFTSQNFYLFLFFFWMVKLLFCHIFMLITFYYCLYITTPLTKNALSTMQTLLPKCAC